MKVIALVDGEHHPDVTRWGLDAARAKGLEVSAALVVGGVEKLGADHRVDLGAVPVLSAEGGAMAALAHAIDRLGPDAVFDLSDEPVLSSERRMELICVALVKGIPYLGPDFRFDPPIVEDPIPVPTLAVIGTGKRVGKTAVAGHAARLATAQGRDPMIVAVGRGGPVEPVFARSQDVTVEALLDMAARGEHAASDYLEDALIAGVPTVGARRSGGGLAGRPFVTNVAEAAQRAVEEGAGLVILEGSGASIPTVPWDAGILVAPGSLPPEQLVGYLGPIRILLSDLVVFIIDSGPSAGPENLSVLDSQVRRLRADIRVATAELIPVPLADVRGKDAFFATTASCELAGRLADALEESAGCRVVATSWRLGDRAGLQEDLGAAPAFQVLLTELKAAAVDVGARWALDHGAEVVFVENRPRAAGSGEELDSVIREILEQTGARAEARLTRQ
jgi:cyclic 2,3-diphosphoglycerate synthetase